ncbi:MAG: UpxY family transcription antiterminator [Bacteroidota bacterium]
MAESIPGDLIAEVKLQDSLWYAVYTRSRSEKRLMELLSAKGIEAYVPLHKVVRQWSDRKKIVEEPLIRSYCFVKVEPPDYYEVLNTPGAVRYVWFSGRPATIPEKQINLLKSITLSNVETESLPDTFRPGARVRVNGGPLKGLTGELVTISNKKKVILRLDQLQQVISFTISPLLLDIVPVERMAVK